MSSTQLEFLLHGNLKSTSHWELVNRHNTHHELEFFFQEVNSIARMDIFGLSCHTQNFIKFWCNLLGARRDQAVGKYWVQSLDTELYQASTPRPGLIWKKVLNSECICKYMITLYVYCTDLYSALSLITWHNMAQTSSVWIVMQMHWPIFILFYSKRWCIHLLRKKTKPKPQYLYSGKVYFFRK